MNAFFDQNIAIIGMGNIGKMLLERLRIMGVPFERLFVCDTDLERVKAVVSQTGCKTFELLQPTGINPSVWLLCVGPKAILSVLRSLKGQLHPGHVIISFAAAVPMEELEQQVPQGVNVVRVMPNMPSLIGQGMNPASHSQQSSADTREMVKELLKQLGETVEVRDDQMNWCVGLSGAAMRSVLPAIEGMIRAGVEAGLTETEARHIAAQVVLGTAELVKQPSMTIQQIKQLTPMETLDENLVEKIYYAAASGAKEKIEALQQKILLENQ
jgi:pyrroline-5-carboxylate reductase